MAILNAEIVKFANGNTDFYEAAIEHFSAKEPSAERDALLDKAFFAEIEKKSGVKREGLAIEAWVSHPAVKWASFAIMDATINAILPQVLTPAFGLFTDMRFIGFGDIMKFKVMPGTLYTVSKGGRGERTTFRQRKHSADVIVTPEEHIITIWTNLYSVLAGREHIGDFVRNVVLAVEQDMYGEAIDAMVTGIDAATNGSDLSVTGAFDMKKLLKVAEKVQVLNQNVRPIIAGSAVALMNVIPDSTSGYRGIYGADGARIELLRGVYGYDVLKMDQALSKDGKLALPDDKIFILSPAQDKLVKGAVSSALTNGNQAFDNADISENFTYRKLYDFVYASNAKAGVYKITE